jgi:hypothetical protein
VNTTRLIHHLPRFLALAGLVIAASGCSSGMTREECQVVDWQGIGYEDGLRGRPQASMASHRKACARHGVALDLGAYRQGWDTGVRQYCQPGNGYRQGRNGSAYNAVCPPDLEPAFLEAYREGRELHDLQAEVRRLSHAIANKRQRLPQLETAIVDTTVSLVRPGVTPQERILILDDLRRLEHERDAIKDEIPVLEMELARRQEDLEIVSMERKY